MLYNIEAQVQACQLRELLEILDMCDVVVVEIDIFQRSSRRPIGRKVEGCELVLS